MSLSGAQGAEIFRTVSPADPNRYIATLDQVAAHTRIGAPFSGSPSTDVAMTSTSDALNRASAFPSGSGTDLSSGFPLPSNQATTPYAASMPDGTQVPESGRAAATDTRPPNPSAPPLYVTNQYAPTAGSATGTAEQRAYVPQQRQTAEQRASYTPPYGGQFQAAPSTPPYQGGYPPSPGVSRPDATLPSMTSPRDAQPRDNEYMAAAQNASARSTTNESFAPPQPSVDVANGQPTIALNGYCPVSLVEQEKWVQGDPRWGAVHRGRTYLFTGAEAQQRFLADFNKYAPALSGYDCVKYAEQGALVDGQRAHGVFYRGQIFLFADEAALRQFWSTPERFVPVVLAEQQRQAARASHAPR